MRLLIVLSASLCLALVLAACGGGGKFSLDKTTVKPAEALTVSFPGPIASPETDRHWITIIEKGKPDAEWGQWQYVTDKATTMQLVAPSAPGAYEVRLHANYPAKQYNVVHRLSVTVQ